MLIELPTAFIDSLVKTAERMAWDDFEKFEEEGCAPWAGCNIDDAFQGGYRSGEIWSARELLSCLSIEFSPPKDK